MLLTKWFGENSDLKERRSALERYVSTLFELIKAALEKNEPKTEELRALSNEELVSLYRLSKAHDLSHIVGEMLTRCEIPMEEALSSRFLKQQMLAVYRHERLQDTYTRVCDLFEAQGIDHMPLKGAVIRPYYPEAWMRTSCDIDILVKEEDVDRAAELVGETFGIKEHYGKSFHDVSLLLEGGVHLELHFNIIEEIEPMDTVLRTVWEHAALKDGTSHCYLQTNAFLLFHLVAHNAYHFIKGGCGIRPFVDWWLLKKHLTVDEAELERLLRDASLLEFACGMDDLCGVWFEGIEHTELTGQMEKFILGAGVYGSLENRVTVGRETSGGGLSYIFKRIFLPMKELKKLYPRLEKAPVLYPFYTVVRWFTVIFSGRGKKAAREIKSSVARADEYSADVARMCHDLHLIQ